MDNSLSFYNFCEHLQTIRSATHVNKKTMLEKMILEYKSHNENINPLLCLLLPKMDKTKGPYGMKEHTLGKAISKYFNVPKTSENFKKLNIQLYPDVLRKGDFAEIAGEAVRIYMKPTNVHLSVLEIDEYLSRISSESNSIQTFRELLSKLTILELKWIIRIILKEIKIGLSSKDILSVYHPEAGNLTEEKTNLKDIIEKVNTLETTFNFDKIALFSFVRPMLSLRTNGKMLKYINLKDKYVEEKYDGERFQLHYTMNGEYKWFSRTGNEYNRTFEALALKIAKQLSKSVQNIIVDGEMVGYNRKTGQYGTKGYNYDIKKINNRSLYDPCFKIFDILFYNGQDITKKPLYERKQIISTILEDCEGVVFKSKYIKIENELDVVRYFNKSIEQNWEGIILKDHLSTYTPNGRTEQWIKMKADYFDNVLVELDLLIIGGYYGTGKFSGEIQTYLMAVLDYSNSTKRYISVSTSGLGLTNKESRKLGQYLTRKGPWKRRITDDSTLECVAWGKEKPHVWRHPDESIILEIRASELHKSSNFLTTHTLRFPRIIKVRYDKPLQDCMTLKEFNNIIRDSSEPVVKLCKRVISIDDLFHTTSKQLDSVKLEPKESTVETSISKEYNVIKTSNKLDGKQIIVMTGTDSVSKDELEHKIIENGGIVTRKLGSNTWCIVAGKIDYCVDTLIKTGNKNIVKAEWLLQELEKSNDESLVHWTPLDTYCLSIEYQKKFNVLYDRFGDSFTEHATVESLLKVLKNMPNEIDMFSCM